MNTENTAPAPSPRTSGLAIAAFICGLLSCLCLPALPAWVMGVIALLQMGKDPNLKGKGFAIAGLVVPFLMIPVLLAAIAVPNFIRFQARSRQSEAKVTLRAIGNAQRAREEDGFTEHAKELGFEPESGHRYAYLLSANPVAGDTALYGTGKGALGEAQVREALRKPLAGNVVLGMDPESGVFTAVGVGNVDSDDGVDIWSVSSIAREAPDGTIEPWEPYNEWNDVMDERGSLASGAQSKFDD